MTVEATVPPWSGQLSEESLPAVLRRVFAEKRTGRLTLAREAETIRLFFDAGELRTATSSVESRRIGDVLLRRGHVKEEDFRAALAADGDRRTRLGKLLVERGLVPQNILDAEIRRLAEEIVYSAFTWKDGVFFFEDETVPEADVWLDHSTAALIIEGIRRLPDSEDFVARLNDLDRRPAAIGDPMTRYGVVRLAPHEGYLFSLCNGATPLRDIVKLAPSRASGAKILFALYACGLIEDTVPAAPAAPAEVLPTFVSSAEPAAPPREIAIDTVEPDQDARYAVARASYVRARQLLEARDVFGAIVLLEECAKLVPENSEYHYRLATALSKNPRWGERTIQQFQKALALAPNRPEAMRDLAEFLLSRHRPADARIHAARLFERYPEEPRHAELLTRCEEAMGIARPAEPSAASDGEKDGRSFLGRLFRRDSE